MDDQDEVSALGSGSKGYLWPSNEVRTEDSGPYFEQESLHPDYWGQLAARSCVRQLYAQQTRVNSTCSRAGTGLTSRGEPVMTLQPR